MTRILILGGTKEAVMLAGRLVAEGHDVTTSLAGRTREPMPVAGRMRSGGFGGVEGLTKYLIENKIQRLIDATHPFARQISQNALHASKQANVTLEIHTRPPWKKQADDRWIDVSSLEDARDCIPENARVLLALGSQHIGLFKSRTDVYFLVRMVEAPDTPLPLPNHQLLVSRPSSDWQKEKSVLEQNLITHIVCRNSGGTGAYAKIEAARHLGLDVIMIGRNETASAE